MKIDTSVVEMNSTRFYQSVESLRINSQENKWEKIKPKDDQGGKNKQDKLDKQDELSKLALDTKRLLEDQKDGMSSASSETSGIPGNNVSIAGAKPASGAFPSLSSAEDGKLSILRQMLDMLLKDKGSGSGSSFKFSSSTIQFSSQMSSISFGSIGSSGPAVPGQWVKNVEATHFFSEQESTSFSSVGIAKTEDGREIAFNVDLQMSRSFMEYTNVNWSEEIVMKDPLVINLNSNPTSLSDQKFFFDIDSDGKEDEISQLNKGSGYLALDKNGDGKINDGSELFGAKTGNGFAELSAYDSDGNGWIDENDEIYNKLKVWVKNEDGTDKLLDLKSADVGAIFLGNSKTDFTLKSAESGQVNGQVRRTGVYLKESTGMAGTVQQIDLSV